MTECKNSYCITCGTHKSKLKDTPWSGKKTKYNCNCDECKIWKTHSGIQCKDCYRAQQKRAIEDYKPIDDSAHDHNKEPVCPFCGYKMTDAWEISDDESVHECSNCDSTYNVYRHTEVTYTTSKLKEEE